MGTDLVVMVLMTGVLGGGLFVLCVYAGALILRGVNVIVGGILVLPFIQWRIHRHGIHRLKTK